MKERIILKTRPRWEDSMKMDLKKQVGKAQAEFIWLKIGKSVKVL